MSSPVVATRIKIELLALAIVLLAGWFRFYRLDQIPPALHWDEAFDGLDALRLIQTPSHPVFFDGDNGREPFTIYLQAVGLVLWGIREWSLRAVSAILGIVTVSVVYRLGVSLYAGQPRAQMIGLLSSAMLAVSFWHVAISRLALRVISFPLLSAITACLFWRAWQTRRLRDYALCGLALGLTLYTYLAARLLPVVLLGFVLIVARLSLGPREVRFPRIDRYRHWMGLGAMLAAMLVVFAPLGDYFLRHPSAFVVRANQISIFSGNAQGFASLPYNALVATRMFIDRGDSDALRNLPGEPALNFVMALGFWIGLALALARFKVRPAYLLLLLWFATFFAASWFSVDNPSALRMSGTLPAVLILAADGLLSVWERAIPRRSPLALVLGIVALSGTLTFNDYFLLWGPSRATFDTVYGPMRTVVERAMALSYTSDVVLPFSIYRLPSAQFYLASRFSTARPMSESRNADPVAWIATGETERTVVILRRDGSIVVPQPLNDTQVARLDRTRKRAERVQGPFGEQVGEELRVDGAEFLAPLQPTHPLDANFGGQIRLLGYDLTPTTIAPGNRVRVTYYWESLVDQELNYTSVSTLLNAGSNSFGKRLADPVYETSLWRRGAVIPESFDFQVPASAPDGKYRFELALIHSDAPDQALPLSESEDRFRLDAFTVTRQNVEALAAANPLAVHLGQPPLIQLLGYDLKQMPSNGEDKIAITLYWKALQRTDLDYSIFLHLVDGTGKIIAQEDGPPQSGNAPTSWWVPGDVIADSHELAIPSKLAPGRYTLAIGVYDSLRGPRLPMFDAAGTPKGDAWQIAITSP